MDFEAEHKPLLHQKPTRITLNIVMMVIVMALLRTSVHPDITANQQSMIIALSGLLYGVLIGYNVYVNKPDFPPIKIMWLGALWAIGFTSALVLSLSLCLPMFVMMLFGSMLIINNRDLTEHHITTFITSVMLIAPLIGIMALYPDLKFNEDSASLIASLIVGVIAGGVHGFIFSSSQIDIPKEKHDETA